MIYMTCDQCGKRDIGYIGSDLSGTVAVPPIRFTIQDVTNTPPVRAIWAKDFCSQQCCSDWLTVKAGKMFRAEST